MEDSLLIARLTLMLLHASAQDPDSLRADYGVIIAPSDDILSQTEAAERLARIPGPLVVSSAQRGRNLVVFLSPPDADERMAFELAANNIVEGLRSLTATADPTAVVRVVSKGAALLAPVGVIERWVSRFHCLTCSVSLGVRRPQDPPSVIGVVYLGP